MTTPLSPTGDAFVAQRTLEDGDALNQAKFTEAFGDAAERSEFLKKRTETTGVLKIRTVASVTALKALTPALAQAAVVYDQATGDNAMFIFTDVPAAADIEGMLYRLATPANGSWINVAKFLSATTGGKTRLKHDVLAEENRIVSWINSTVTSSTIETSISGADAWVNLMSISRDLQVGDVLQLSAHSVAKASEPGLDPVKMRLYVETAGGGSALVASEIEQHVTQNKKLLYSTQGTFTAASAVSHTLRIQVWLPGAGGDYNVEYAPISMQGLIIRP